MTIVNMLPFGREMAAPISLQHKLRRAYDPADNYPLSDQTAIQTMNGIRAALIQFTNSAVPRPKNLPGALPWTQVRYVPFDG